VGVTDHLNNRGNSINAKAKSNVIAFRGRSATPAYAMAA